MTRADAAIAANKRDFIVAFLSIVDASLGGSGLRPRHHRAGQALNLEVSRRNAMARPGYWKRFH
jgi:hypothetical protein